MEEDHDIYKVMRECMQEDLKVLLPRRYSMPAYSYPADEAPLQGVAHMRMCTERIVEPNQNNANWFISSCMFRKYGSRVYAVTPELALDLSRTSLKGLDMPSLRWPLKSFCLSFPKETVFLNDTDGYLTGMLVCVEPDLQDLREMALEFGVDYEHKANDPGKFMVCSSVSSGAAYSCSTYLKDFSIDALEKLSFSTTLASGGSLDTITPGDKESSRKLMEVFVKVLSYLNARPSDLEQGALKAKAKNKSKKHAPKLDWWKPWVIGLDRQKQAKIVAGTNPGAGERGSCIPHWRCGHWRHVHYGKGRENTRLVFIEPVMVNKEK